MIAPGWMPGSRAQRLARQIADEGCETTLMQFSVGRDAPCVRFDDGVWTHSGGTLRARRWRWLPRFRHRAHLTRDELRRMMPIRAFQVYVRPAGNRFALGTIEPVSIEAQGSRAQLVVEPLSERHRAVAVRVAALVAACLERQTATSAYDQRREAGMPAPMTRSIGTALGSGGAGR